MAPIIEVSDEHYEAIRTLGIQHKLVEAPRVEVVSEPYIEVPEIGLAVAKELTHRSENWYEQQESLKREGSIMLPTRKFAGFLAYLIAHPENKEYQAILEEIVGVRSPWRGENLDDYFVEENGVMYDLTQNRAHKEKLAGCLMQDRTINLADWLKNPTPQGLPKSDVKDGNLLFWFPRLDSVAGFDAYSNRANLYCYGDPAGRNSYLGVRAAKVLAR